jgi:membrane-associated phospholipid phosphatase
VGKKLALIISYIFHPLLMPTMLFSVLLLAAPQVFSPYSFEQMKLLIVLIFVTTFVIPLLSMSTLKLTGTISSFMLEKRKERLLPFFFTVFFYAITVYMFTYRIGQLDAITVLLGTITVIIFVVALLTIKIKISAHSAGMGGGIGFLWALKLIYPDMMLLLPLLGTILITGGVMTSRMYLNAHRPLEIYLGGAIGIVISFCSIFLWFY